MSLRFPSRLFLLPILLRPLLRLPLLLLLQLIRPSQRNILWPEITKHLLQHLLNDEACPIIQKHHSRDHRLELGSKRDKLHLLIDLRYKLGGARERDGRDEHETPVHALVLADGLTEGTALVVDGEGGDLLNELEKVNCAVQEGGFEFAFEVDVVFLGLGSLDVPRHIDESDNVNSKLAENGANDVWVEDVVLGSFFRKSFDRLDAVRKIS